MNRWRWQIWLPRVMLVAVMLLAAQYVLGLAMRSKVIRSTEAAIGTQVDLAHARASVFDRQVVIRGLRVTDPRQSTQNLVEADYGEFNVASGPLLHKRTVIERG